MNPGIVPKRLLEGVRVIDLTHFLAGPYAAMILGELGAEVILVEQTTHRAVPYSRFATLVPEENGESDRPYDRCPWFNAVNQCKKSLTLDIAKPKGIGILKKLIAVSDVIVVNFNPRVMENFGLTYDHVREINPSIVYTSISGYGTSGPSKYRNATASTVAASSGLMHLTGYTDGPPYLPGFSHPDFSAAVHAAYATLAALFARRRAGNGQYIEVAMQEVVTASVGEALMDYLANSRIVTRRGNAHSFMVPHGCYRCRGDDSWVTIAVAFDSEWQDLCRAMERTDLLRDQELATVLGRSRRRQEVDRLVQEWTVERTPTEVVQLLRVYGIPCASVSPTQEFLRDPHTEARSLYRERSGSGGEAQLAARIPMLLSKIPWRRDGAAPKYGEHNREVLEESLGLSIFEVNKLIEDRTITFEPFNKEM